MNIALRITVLSIMLAGLSLPSRTFANPPGGPGGAPHPQPPSQPLPNPHQQDPAPQQPVRVPRTSPTQAKNDRTTVYRVLATVTSISGTALKLTLWNGESKTFTLNADALPQLHPQVGQKVIVESDQAGAMVDIVPADQTITGTVVTSAANTVTLRLDGGQTRTFTLAASAALMLSKLQPGMHVTVVSHDAWESAASIAIIP